MLPKYNMPLYLAAFLHYFLSTRLPFNIIAFLYFCQNTKIYLSAMMNIDPLCCKHVPLLLMWFLEMFKGCGNPEWYQVPCQLAGNWHCFDDNEGTVVIPTLINARDRLVHKKLWHSGIFCIIFFQAWKKKNLKSLLMLD